MSRDTWGGDANRPGSFNRWNYVEANPVNLRDPSGNMPDYCTHVSAEYWNSMPGCPGFGTQFTCSWIGRDRSAVGMAIEIVGERLMATTPGVFSSSVDAFNQVYGIHNNVNMEMKWDLKCLYCKPAQCRKDGNEKGVDYDYDWTTVDDDGKTVYVQIKLPDGINSVSCSCEPKGGYTHTDHLIEFASLWPKYTGAGYDIQQLRKINNVIHELGHAFNGRVGGDSLRNVVTSYSEVINGSTFRLTDRKKRGFYEDQYGTMTWVQSAEETGGEIFADMFIGWAYGKWADNAFGTERAEFMRQNMSGWITNAKNHH